MPDLTIRHETPAPAEYLHLRRAAGLSAFSEEAAARGLEGGLFAVTLREGDALVGMGRVIGDGGCFLQIVDIAVRPDRQGEGLGGRIMAALTAWLEAEAPPDAYVSLIADRPADRLYQRWGFAETAPASIGMARRAGPQNS